MGEYEKKYNESVEVIRNKIDSILDDETRYRFSYDAEVSIVETKNKITSNDPAIREMFYKLALYSINGMINAIDSLLDTQKLVNK